MSLIDHMTASEKTTAIKALHALPWIGPWCGRGLVRSTGVRCREVAKPRAESCQAQGTERPPRRRVMVRDISAIVARLHDTSERAPDVRRVPMRLVREDVFRELLEAVEPVEQRTVIRIVAWLREKNRRCLAEGLTEIAVGYGAAANCIENGDWKVDVDRATLAPDDLTREMIADLMAIADVRVATDCQALLSGRGGAARLGLLRERVTAAYRRTFPRDTSRGSK